MQIQKSNLQHTDKGFTLIEVMIAMLVFSFGMLALGSMQITSIQGNASARDFTQVASLGTDYISGLLHQDYDGSDLTAGAHSPTSDVDGIDNDNDGDIDETGETGDISVAWVVVDNVLNTKTVTLTMSWNDQGENRSVTMRHIIPEII